MLLCGCGWRQRKKDKVKKKKQKSIIFLLAHFCLPRPSAHSRRRRRNKNIYMYTHSLTRSPHSRRLNGQTSRVSGWEREKKCEYMWHTQVYSSINVDGRYKRRKKQYSEDHRVCIWWRIKKLFFLFNVIWSFFVSFLLDRFLLLCLLVIYSSFTRDEIFSSFSCSLSFALPKVLC